MSDLGRKDLSSKVSDSVTPDSQKSTLDKASETASGAADKVAGSVQPQGDKSVGQQAGDKASGSDSKGIVESAQDTLNSASKSVSDALGGKCT